MPLTLIIIAVISHLNERFQYKFTLLGTHDIHALILGRAITDIQAFK